MSSTSNHRLFSITHENNRRFLNVSEYEVIYENNPRLTVTDPRLEVYGRATHHLVPENLNHNIPPPLSHGIKIILNQTWLNNSINLLSADEDYAMSAFEYMLVEAGTPFHLGDPDSYGPLCWRDSLKDTETDRPGDVPLDGISGAAARVLEEFKRIVAGVHSRRRAGQEVAVIRLEVRIVKRTVVDSELYKSFGKVRFKAAVNSLKEVNHGGDESESCSICLTDVPSVTRVSQLPCSHWFHKDCIVNWFTKSQTCPLCRFELVEHYFGN